MDENQEELYQENLKLKEEIASLKHSLEFNTYKLLFESSPDIIIQVDINYKIMVLHIPNYTNERLDALKGMDMFSVTPESVHDQMRDALIKVFATGEVVTYESEAEALGSYRYFANHLSAIKNERGQIDSAYFVSREITERKVANIQALESEQKLTALFEGSSQILSLFDKDSKFVWYNRTAYDKSIYLFGKFIEAGVRFEEFLKPEFREEFNANFRKVLNGEIIVYNREYVYEDKPFFLEIMLQPVYQHGELIGVSLVGISNTERKEYEARLEKANKELIQQNDQLNQYSYIISHNLRAPIVTLLGLVTIFNQTKNNPTETEAIIAHIQKSAHHLDTVIKDLNHVLSVNDKKAIISSVNLDGEFDIVRFLLKNEIEESKASITCDFSNYPFVQSIKSYIHNILYNLLSNALKYKKEHKAPHIKVSSYKHETGMICIEFTDDGIGVDLEKFKDKLFGFYKRFHTHVEGKGLGLHLIKKQIDVLEGRIEVESVVNHGTTFRILLPE
ncbi:MAG: PAS domain-containing sensor histidine kinase [Cytophagales bacterium]|nr:PAS domain-containing sensor histidine kinase [Cytophaga sp.]